MSQVQEISIQLDGISNVLKTRRFRVPAYQRSYAWETEHVEALLNDVGEAIKGGEKEYFLGSLVVTGPIERRFEVVDGQQRLTTISLMISTIRDRFRQNNDTEAETSIRNDYLASVDRKTKEREARLVLNEVDNELYQELIEDRSNIERSKFAGRSHKRLLAASDFMAAYVEKLCNNAFDEEEELHAWLDYLDTNLKVILVIAPDDSNAFVIFETLNDRGLELAISDLLKNYLFHRAGDKIEEAKNRWLTMNAILEGASDEPLVVTYLRHFAMSKYGLVREKDLFGVIKSKVTSKKAALQLSSDLSNSAKVYAGLINTDHEFWAKYDGVAKDAVRALNVLGMIQMRPLLLAILDKFDEKSVAKSFRFLVSVAVRFQIVGGAGGGTLERIYSDAAKGVTDGSLTSIDQILKQITNLPPDANFIQAFSVASISKQGLARFYLRALEMGNSGTKVELVPSEDTARVNLEHVLPVTPSGEWLKTWSTEDAKAFQNRIGNLAILSSKMNSIIGNDAFSVKKKELAKSQFEFTKMIDVEIEWNKDAIERRQMKMAQLAARVWSIKL